MTWCEQCNVCEAYCRKTALCIEIESIFAWSVTRLETMSLRTRVPQFHYNHCRVGQYDRIGSDFHFNDSVSCGTSLHYVPLRTLMVLFDQNNFRLNKTGLHMVDTWSVHPNLTFVTSRVCLDVMMRALTREHRELLSDWLSLA